MNVTTWFESALQQLHNRYPTITQQIPDLYTAVGSEAPNSLYLRDGLQQLHSNWSQWECWYRDTAREQARAQWQATRVSPLTPQAKTQDYTTSQYYRCYVERITGRPWQLTHQLVTSWGTEQVVESFINTIQATEQMSVLMVQVLQVSTLHQAGPTCETFEFMSDALATLSDYIIRLANEACLARINSILSDFIEFRPANLPAKHAKRLTGLRVKLERFKRLINNRRSMLFSTFIQRDQDAPDSNNAAHGAHALYQRVEQTLQEAFGQRMQHAQLQNPDRDDHFEAVFDWMQKTAERLYQVK